MDERSPGWKTPASGSPEGGSPRPRQPGGERPIEESLGASACPRNPDHRSGSGRGGLSYVQASCDGPEPARCRRPDPMSEAAPAADPIARVIAGADAGRRAAPRPARGRRPDRTGRRRASEPLRIRLLLSAWTEPAGRGRRSGPSGPAPRTGPLPGGRSDWRDDHRYCRINRKKSGPPTRGQSANVSMMNSPGPGWAYMPSKTISPCETMVSQKGRPVDGNIGPTV